MTTTQLHTEAKLIQLFIYPVKSLAGIEVESATVTPKGLARDREWMIVNAAGRYVTQRKVAKLAAIKVALLDHGLRLSHAAAGDIEVENPPADAPTQSVGLWQDTCLAQAAKPEVNAWLAEALGDDAPGPLQLVKFAAGFSRAAKPERFGDATTHFADAAPFLVANQLSLNALNIHLQEQGLQPVDMRRFRPNLVADGLPAFVEHDMAAIQIAGGAVEWQLCDPCQRCAIITVNPDTGERTPKTVPFKQLALLNPMPDNRKAPAFGVNARLACGDGNSVQTGSTVHWC